MDAAPNARVYAIGYPEIVKADGDCGVNVRLTRAETEFATSLIHYLDSVIKSAADSAILGIVFWRRGAD